MQELHCCIAAQIKNLKKSQILFPVRQKKIRIVAINKVPGEKDTSEEKALSKENVTNRITNIF